MSSIRHSNTKSIHSQHHPILDRRQKEIMQGGNASRAQSIITQSIVRLRMHFKTMTPENYISRARVSLMPIIETSTVKRGGASYQVPQPIHLSRRESLAVRWFVDASKSRVKKDKTHGMAEAIALEVIAITHDISSSSSKAKATATTPTAATKRLKPKSKTSRVVYSQSMAKLLSVHRTAKVNRVFSHRRWH